MTTLFLRNITECRTCFAVVIITVPFNEIAASMAIRHGFSPIRAMRSVHTGTFNSVKDSIDEDPVRRYEAKVRLNGRPRHLKYSQNDLIAAGTAY